MEGVKDQEGRLLGLLVGNADGYMDGFVEGTTVGPKLGAVVWICIEFAIACSQARPLRVPSPSTAKSKSYATPPVAAMLRNNDSVKVSLAPGARSLTSPSGSASYIPENGLVTVALRRLASNRPTFVAV